MTDNTNIPQAIPPVIDMTAIMQKYAAWEADAEKLVPKNKAGLLAFLASAGITLVTVTFDGCGDSGQIEDVTAFRGDKQADLPPGTVKVLFLSQDADKPVANYLSAGEAIEDLAYDLLRQKHCGWENNEGGYGEFSFDVTAGRIELDYNERISTSEHYGHAW